MQQAGTLLAQRSCTVYLHTAHKTLTTSDLPTDSNQHPKLASEDRQFLELPHTGSLQNLAENSGSFHLLDQSFAETKIYF